MNDTKTEPEFEPSEYLNKLAAGLSEEQLRWCENYQKGMSAVDALNEAGMSTGDASADGKRALSLAHSPRLRLYMDELNKCIAHDSGVSIAWIDKKWADIASTNVADIVEIGELYKMYGPDGLPSGAPVQIIQLKDFEQLTAAQRTAIKKIEPTSGGVKIELHDKMKALEMLAKRRDFTEKSEVHHTGGVQVVTYVGRNNRGPQDIEKK